MSPKTESIRVAIVTGGGNGIGRAICLKLSSAGWIVVVSDLDLVAAEETAAHCIAAGAVSLSYQTDCGDSDSVDGLINFSLRHFGRLDAYINNAGVEGVMQPFETYPEEVFDQVMRVNTRGVFLGIRGALRVFIKQGSGVILNVASTSSIRGRKCLAAYVASKHAVLGLTRVAALEVQGTAIRVNAVLPGPIQTRMINSLDHMAASLSSGSSGAIQRSGASLYGEPEDIANTAAYLVSDESKHVNGAAWVVDAGSTVA